MHQRRNGDHDGACGKHGRARKHGAPAAFDLDDAPTGDTPPQAPEGQQRSESASSPFQQVPTLDWLPAAAQNQFQENANTSILCT